MSTEEEERGEPVLTIRGVRYYNATQAADYLGMPRETFYKRVRPHLVGVVPPNYSRRFFTADELDQFK